MLLRSKKTMFDWPVQCVTGWLCLFCKSHVQWDPCCANSAVSLKWMCFLSECQSEHGRIRHLTLFTHTHTHTAWSQWKEWPPPSHLNYRCTYLGPLRAQRRECCVIRCVIVQGEDYMQQLTCSSSWPPLTFHSFRHFTSPVFTFSQVLRLILYEKWFSNLFSRNPKC